MVVEIDRLNETLELVRVNTQFIDQAKLFDDFVEITDQCLVLERPAIGSYFLIYRHFDVHTRVAKETLCN